MEAQQQQQQQQQQEAEAAAAAYHYQYQTLNDPNATAVVPLPYDSSSSSSHLQSYDQSTQAHYYAAYQHYDQTQPQPQQQPQQDYSSYYYHPDYSNSYQTDPNSIHPPGVPILPADTQQPHLPNAQNVYYSATQPQPQPPPSQPYTLASNTAYKSTGSHTGQSVRGGLTRRGTFGRHGRGRGGGARGKGAKQPPQIPGSSSGAVDPPQGAKKPPQNAWCEICKVNCTTPEILEQHRNGKKHQKNSKVYEELQNLRQLKTTENNPQIQVANSKIVENSPTNEPENAEAKSEAPPKIDESIPTAEFSPGVAPMSEKSVWRDRFKRGTRGGRGGKFMKASDGSRRKPVFEPPKQPKHVGFPVVCELCSVKCESQVVYDSHITGKKHLANAKRVEARIAGGGGVQALYQTVVTPISNLPPQHHHQSSHGSNNPQDAETLASMMLSHQNLQDPQAAHAALTQLLSQHGIHDAQTLLVQLIPYLLTQFQAAPVGSVAAAGGAPALAGLGMVNSVVPQTEGMMTVSLPESKAEEDVQNETNNEGMKGEDGVENNGKLGEGECLDRKPVEGVAAVAKEEESVEEKEKEKEKEKESRKEEEEEAVVSSADC